MNVLNWLSAKDSIGDLFCFSVAQGDTPFLHSFQESTISLQRLKLLHGLSFLLEFILI